MHGNFACLLTVAPAHSNDSTRTMQCASLPRMRPHPLDESLKVCVGSILVKIYLKMCPRPLFIPPCIKITAVRIFIPPTTQICVCMYVCVRACGAWCNAARACACDGGGGGASDIGSGLGISNRLEYTCSCAGAGARAGGGARAGERGVPGRTLCLSYIIYI